jgi:hypothetical protein
MMMSTAATTRQSGGLVGRSVPPLVSTTVTLPAALGCGFSLECLGEERERGDVEWAANAEVLAVHRRDLGEVQAFGDRDHGCIDDAEWKAHLLLDEFRDARDVAFCDLGNVEAVAAERLEEGDLCVRPDAGLEQVADLAQDWRRDEEWPLGVSQQCEACSVDGP